MRVASNRDDERSFRISKFFARTHDLAVCSTDFPGSVHTQNRHAPTAYTSVSIDCFYVVFTGDVALSSCVRYGEALPPAANAQYTADIPGQYECLNLAWGAFSA